MEQKDDRAQEQKWRLVDGRGEAIDEDEVGGVGTGHQNAACGGCVPCWGCHSTQDQGTKMAMKIEPKVFFANERTMMKWLHMASLLGSIGGGLMGFSRLAEKDGSEPVHIMGAMMVGTAIVFTVYSVTTFYWRARAIRTRSAGPYDDRVGPVLLAGLLAMCFIASLAVHVSALYD